MTRQPFVSVVLPTRGRNEALLFTAVASVDAQTVEDVELVVVDDSAEFVSSALADAEWSTITSIVFVRRGCSGVSEARNAGIRASSGTFVSFIDDDDQWDSRKLERQIGRIRGSEGAEISICGYEAVNGNGAVVGEYVPTLTGKITEEILRGVDVGPTPTLVVTRDLIERSSVRFDTRLDFWEDRDWVLRLSTHSSVVSVPERLVRMRADSPEKLTHDTGAIRTAIRPYVTKHVPLATTFGYSTLVRFWIVSLLTAGKVFVAAKLPVR